MARMNEKVVLISGGARGMGASHARVLAQEGAKVVIGDVLEEEGRALAQEIGDAAQFTRLDVTDYTMWESAVKVAETHYGKLDVVVNNAGISNSAPVDKFPLEAWDQIISINLTGVFYGIRSAVPAMRRAGRGSIINISSIAGLKGIRNVPGYTAAKFGVRGLTKSAAIDLGRDKIRVNSVHPGLVRTPMIDGIDDSQKHVALGRVAEAREVSDLVLFLGSEESSYCTGAEFVIDGGETAGNADYVAREQPTLLAPDPDSSGH